MQDGPEGRRSEPANWQTTWTNTGTGVAFHDASGNSFAGNGMLRLHIGPGGGSLFVLSDLIPVSPSTTYLISSRMRFALESDSDSVFFSVIQLDTAGNDVGFDEVTGRKGENFWSWQQTRLAIHTRSNTAFIRIRFALVSASETYLDVDDVR